MAGNALYGITALRYAGTNIVEAMMGLMDPSSGGRDLHPRPARLTEIVDKLLEGDTVISMFSGEDGRYQRGPVVLVDVLPEGNETLAFDEQASGRTIRDLPRF